MGLLALAGFFMFLRAGGFGGDAAENVESAGGGSVNLDKAIAREVRAQLLKEVAAIQNKAAKSGQLWPPVATLPERHRKRVLVTGGAGFVGSNLVDRLMMQGHEVIVLDNMFTGRKKNVQHWIGHPSFQMIVGDVVNPIFIEVDQIYNLACPASPPHYQYNPIKTIKTSTEGTLNMLGLAKRVKARILLTSTSEIYGDPEVHPQPETYWGHVNPIGPRSCYDEGLFVCSRFASHRCWCQCCCCWSSVRVGGWVGGLLSLLLLLLLLMLLLLALLRLASFISLQFLFHSFIHSRLLRFFFSFSFHVPSFHITVLSSQLSTQLSLQASAWQRP